MKANACSYISDGELELYLMNLHPAQLAGDSEDALLSEVEEHLLVCPICLTAAETHDRLMTALRSEGSSHLALVR